jgi:hypothetical protein
MHGPKPKHVSETLAPARNFTITLEDRVRAAGGAPAYIRRKRRIEDLEESLLGDLVELFDQVTRELPDDGDRAIDAEVERRVGKRRLALLNDLIGRHNRYYPTEANLPLDPRTGAMLELGRPWTPLPEVTMAELMLRARVLRRVER